MTIVVVNIMVLLLVYRTTPYTYVQGIRHWHSICLRLSLLLGPAIGMYTIREEKMQLTHRIVYYRAQRAHTPYYHNSFISYTNTFIISIVNAKRFTIQNNNRL